MWTETYGFRHVCSFETVSLGTNANDEKNYDEAIMSTLTGNAFVTTRKGFCYLTIRVRRRNYDITKIRQYKIEAQEKRDLRRLYPNVTFDWKKIAEQLEKKRGVCRRYRARRHATSAPKRPREPFYGVVDPFSRTVYVNDPDNIAGVGALLDAMIAGDRAKEP